MVTSSIGDKRGLSRLRYCATSRNIAGWVRDGIFDRPNPYGSTTALGSTQSLTEGRASNDSRAAKKAGE